MPVPIRCPFELQEACTRRADGDHSYGNALAVNRAAVACYRRNEAVCDRWYEEQGAKR